MRVTFDLPDHPDPNGPFPYAVDDVVSYLFLPVAKKDGKYVAHIAYGIGNADPEPEEEFVQTKTSEFFRSVRTDVHKFLEDINKQGSDL